MDQVDAIVIGAGVVGLAAARALAQAGRETVVVEAQNAIGQGVSSRNSEVIHAGLYYAPGSLKARLCARGKELLYEFCAAPWGRSTAAAASWSWPRARPEDRRPCAACRTERAPTACRWNGWKRKKPSRSSRRCSVSPHFRRRPRASWTATASCLRCRRLRSRQAAWWRSARRSTRRAGSRRQAASCAWRTAAKIAPRILVNSASCTRQALASRFDGLDVRHVPPAFFAKGNYYALAGRAPFSRLIYPAPTDVAGRAPDAGPGRPGQIRSDLEWLAVRSRDIDYSVDPARADAFYASVRHCWPRWPTGRAAAELAACDRRSTGPRSPRQTSASTAQRGTMPGPGQPLRHRIARPHGRRWPIAA